MCLSTLELQIIPLSLMNHLRDVYQSLIRSSAQRDACKLLENNPCLALLIMGNHCLYTKGRTTLIIKQLDMRSQIAHITIYFLMRFFLDICTISRSSRKECSHTMTDLINSCFLPQDGAQITKNTTSPLQGYFNPTNLDV